jgi:hypothetical protein
MIELWLDLRACRRVGGTRGCFDVGITLFFSVFSPNALETRKISRKLWILKFLSENTDLRIR